ncbi:MAG: hypothetical protein LBC08_02745 [Campylobacteraceae bacterium]|jgi:hypothetical protein|nr:hypothetical protein [Campylobacteraceae bacterium]
MLKKVSIVVVLVIAALAAFLFQSGKIYSLFQKDIQFFEAKTACDLYVGSCEVILHNDKTITLNIDKPFSAGKAMNFNVRAEGFEDDEFFVQIYGLNMDMGIFEYPLVKTDSGSYVSKVFVPTCMGGKMSWQVNIISKKENIGAGFVLEL